MKIALIVSFLATSLALKAQKHQGRDVRVADGDTVAILDEANVQGKIRLNRIIEALEEGLHFGDVEVVLLCHSFSNNRGGSLCVS